MFVLIPRRRSKEIVMKIPNSQHHRKFGDRWYQYFDWYPSKSEAESVAEKKREAGFFARVRKVLVDQRYPRYQVWTVKK
jgi:hypothetical protein